MAFARPLQQNVDENAVRAARLAGGKPGAVAPAGRRALGDIGNTLSSTFNNGCNVGKDGLGKKGARDGVLTRSQRAQLDAKDSDGTSEIPAAYHAAPAPQRRSMSAQLQCHSEAALPRKKVEPASPMPDIDSQDADDPLNACDYVADIFSYWRRVEAQFRVGPEYMTRQADINDKMRAILIDWLVEVHLKFKLMPETLYLTTNLIDRFLELKGVSRKNLQLVGVTAMLIAAKYEEIWAPEVRDFVYISDRAYTKEQILAMEKVMLNTLKFNLTVPTPHNFLLRYLKASGLAQDKLAGAYASYLVELSLPDYGMLKYSYSMLAAAAVQLTNRSLHNSPYFPRSLQKHAGLTEASVRPCAAAMAALHRKAPTASLVAVFKKYSGSKYHEVAKMGAPLASPEHL